MIISSWNIRGLNRSNKQKEINKLVSINKVDIIGILETKIKMGKENQIQKFMLPLWEFTTNNKCDGFNRIWVAWNPNKIKVRVLKETRQLIHLNVLDIQLNKYSEITYVYGLHTSNERKNLWKDLCSIASSSQGLPWITLGDFNEILDPLETSGGNPKRDPGMDEFSNCLYQACLADLRYTGIFYTWSNRRFERDDFIERKLDRALVNPEWFDNFPNSHTNFQAPGISDHSPVIVDMGITIRKKGLPFKFYNYWVKLDKFDETIEKAWNIDIEGTYQFQLCHKLRNVKAELKKFTKNIFGKEKIHADETRKALMECQSLIDQFPNDLTFRAQENDLMIKFLDAIRIEEEVAKQKSRNQWLEVGDRNTNYFYNAIKVEGT